jgi:hypothetical protein
MRDVGHEERGTHEGDEASALHTRSFPTQTLPEQWGFPPVPEPQAHPANSQAAGRPSPRQPGTGIPGAPLAPRCKPSMRAKGLILSTCPAAEFAAMLPTHRRTAATAAEAVQAPALAYPQPSSPAADTQQHLLPLQHHTLHSALACYGWCMPRLPCLCGLAGVRDTLCNVAV